MANTSGKHILCMMHIGGQFLNGGGDIQYVGGSVRTKIIKEGTTYEELKTIVASIVGKRSSEMAMKFTVRFDDATTFVDLVDDEGVEHFVNFNGEIGHVYVGENANGNTQTTREEATEEQYVTYDFVQDSDVLAMSPPSMFMEESPLLECAMQMIPTPSPGMNSTKWRDLVIGEGQIFANAVALRQTIYKYSISKNFTYKFVKNNKEKIIVKCKVEGCPWYLGAYAMAKDTEFLTIQTYRSEHMHYAQDNLVVCHSARKNLTSTIMIDSLRCNIDKAPNEIRKDMYREYGVSLNYKQAYRGRARALRELHGSTEDSYMLIPWLCKRLTESDPNTVARWEASDSNKFERLFIAYGCSIVGFLQGCRAILYIDGCHLSGPYKGTLLSACAYDADNQLFPLAYAIVSGETLDEWTWFLQNVKEVTREIEITIVSDRNIAIIGAVCNVFGSDRHAFCYRHVKENFSAEFAKITKGRGRMSGNAKENALKFLDAIAYARHDHEYNVAMGTLRAFSPHMAQWVETQGDVHKWAISKFCFKRWDNITTNVAESFNAWILKERKHNVSTLILEHREKLAKKMLASKTAMKNWKNGVGPNTDGRLMDIVEKAENMAVTYYGDNHFQIQRTAANRIINLNVDLGGHKCTCLAWQMSGLPCAHACAAIKHVNSSVYMFVDDCFKLSAQEKIYASSMRPIETHDCPHPNKLTVTQLLTETFLHPPITRRPTGRPKRKRIESQFQKKQVYHCGRCHEAGHTAKTCKNPNPS